MRHHRGLRVAVVLLTVAGLAQEAHSAEKPARRFVAADSSKRRIALIDESGKTVWERRIGSLHNFQVLKNGNILLQNSMTHLIEVNPKTGKTVWEYNAAKSNGNAGKRIEVHGFQRLDNGDTMIAESGAGRIIEVDKAGRLKKSFALKIRKPDAHRDTRLVTKLANGHYLVCHEGDGRVHEYDAAGKVVWEYAVPLFGRKRKGGHGVDAFGNQCFSAVRLKNGNTLIGTGNGHSVIEVTPEKKIVWKLEQNDVRGIQLAWVTTLQVMPSGNIVIGNCHAGPKNPQIVEVTRDKKVVWTFHDFERFGNSLTNSRIVAVDGHAVH